MLNNISYQNYQKISADIRAIDYALSIISWDSQTVAPKGCFEDRGEYIANLSKQRHILATSKEYVSAVKELYTQKENLSDELLFEITRVKKDIEQLQKVPADEYAEYNYLISKAEMTWQKAKSENNYQIFAPVLKQLILSTKKLVKYWSTPSLKGYDVLLDLYEPGYKMSKYDKLFDLLRVKLVPFIKKISEKGYKPSNDFYGSFPIEKQKVFQKYLAEVMCFDLEYGVLGESEHPFTNGFSPSDVRITNHFYENLFTSSIFSALHELGHATYERNVSKDLFNTNSCCGGTMALHESQSRFYENIIGRSYDFWKIHFNKLKETFPKELKNIRLKDFYQFVNEVKPSYIRVEADELTYPLHIMVRYQLEKEIFNDLIDLDHLEERWNELFYEYLGIKVDSPINGILQDSHWSGGAFGYFPTYALGSAYASQIYYSMKKDFNIKESLKSGNTKDINDWLKDKIHKYGYSKSTKDILYIATGKKFNPEYYIKYLINKYSKIYDIK